MTDEEKDLVEKTVRQQQAKKMAYDLLKARDLPIPSDLKREIEGE